jgi:antitoxin (DNA-binding transcriptional repressor) of toxin-antitoxin stability system
MRSIGIREFRDQATQLMASGETLIVERHGEPIGFFVPIVAVDRENGAAALGRLAQAVDRVLEETGITEDQLVKELAPKRRR